MKKRLIPYAVGIGQSLRLAKFNSAITIGFKFDDRQKAKLKAAGVIVLSAEEALSSGQLDAEFIGISALLSGIEKTEIKRRVKNSGVLTWFSNQGSVVAMLSSRLKGAS